MCSAHWDALKDALRERDLFRFVANDGAGATERIKAQLTPGAPAAEGFEPLLNANFGIFGNALQGGGLYLMGTKEDGTPYCPLCELEAHTEAKADEWIKEAADEQLRNAQRLGLVPPAVTQ
jgi:hypothetical protein